MSVVLIDSGGYNLGSVRAALQRLGVKAELTTDHDRIRSASHVILPGVGAAGPAMQKLRDYQLEQLIPALQQPVLGICLGMQIMYAHSEEDDVECLGIFAGNVSRLKANETLRVPHMGWNALQWKQSHEIQSMLPQPAWMYFVHSFAAPVTDETIATAIHGDELTALVQRDNFLAAQFHPERSAKTGQVLLEYFLRTQ